MKKLLITALALSAFVAYSDIIDDEDDGSPMYRLGGIVQKPGTGKGKIVVVNAIKDLKNSDIQFAIDAFNVVLHLSIDVTNKELVGLPSQKKVKDLKANLAIFIGEDKNCEDTLLIAPESRWAYVNVARLREDEPTPKRFVNRVQKEFSRAFAYLCGAANSDHEVGTTGPVTRNLDLDRLYPVCIPLDTYQRIVNYLEGLGVTVAYLTTYENACQQGWAPQPTNAVQRAIWSKVHTPPSNPITIKYEPKDSKQDK